MPILLIPLIYDMCPLCLHNKHTVARICRERFPWLSEPHNLIDLFIFYLGGCMLVNYDDFCGLESPTLSTKSRP